MCLLPSRLMCVQLLAASSCHSPSCASKLISTCRAALATEVPSPDLLLETPHGHTESVISVRMYKHILVQGFYQILVLLLVIFAAPPLIEAYAVRSEGAKP